VHSRIPLRLCVFALIVGPFIIHRSSFIVLICVFALIVGPFIVHRSSFRNVYG